MGASGSAQKNGEERRGEMRLTAQDQQKKVTAALCSSGSHLNRCCIYVARRMRASWAWLEQFTGDIASRVETLGMEEK